jgi:hypothetical protein
VVLELLTSIEIDIAAVRLDAKYRLDTGLDGRLLELEVRADIPVLCQCYARVPQLSRTGDMLSRGTEAITERERRVNGGEDSQSASSPETTSILGPTTFPRSVSEGTF